MGKTVNFYRTVVLALVHANCKMETYFSFAKNL
jgi:hypothetical protein